MLFERFDVPGLVHYSYAVGCPEKKTLAIIDPERNIERYLEFAASHSMKITHVLETHIHADYASGAAHLAERAGAEYCVSKYDKGQTFEVREPHRDLEDGEEITIGTMRLRVLHTPGHTPEHISILAFDPKASNGKPTHMLSGDFVLVGSLGRPDLLGDDATRALAAQLFQSVQKLRDLPDTLEIFPAHGAGSLCGAGMSGAPSTTLRQERMINPYLDSSLTEEAFVERISTHVPPRPPYYTRMKKLNSNGPQKFDRPPGQEALLAEEVKKLLDDGAVAIDLRKQAEFSAGHIPGSFGIGLGASLAVWASWVVPYDTPIVLIPESPTQPEEAARGLIRVGLDNIVGQLEGGVETWMAKGYDIDHITLMDARELETKLSAGELSLIDVRHDDEFTKGHAPGALHVPGEFLAERVDELPDRHAPVAVTCRSGYRSVVAASVLKRAGFTNVIDLAGGMTSWLRAGLPTESSAFAGAKR
jgi:hydroxyacylglutathione hydrolase